MKNSDTIRYIGFLITLIFIFQGCSTIKTNKMNDQLVRITGVAQNGKAGALVKTNDGKAYYIEGLNAWPLDIHNKQVTVSGKLKTETVDENEMKNEQGEWKAGLVGEIKTIRNAVWKLL